MVAVLAVLWATARASGAAGADTAADGSGGGGSATVAAGCCRLRLLSRPAPRRPSGRPGRRSADSGKKTQ